MKNLLMRIEEIEKCLKNETCRDLIEDAKKNCKGIN